MRPNPNIAPVEWPYRDSSAREEWRICPASDRYEVSSLGNVRRIGRDQLRVLPPNADGYLMVSIHRPGRTPKNYRVHQLVCRAFNGPPNALHRDCAHLDGDLSNNRANNLKWVSHAENMSHKVGHGTHQRGERHPSAVLTNEAALQVVQLLSQGSTSRDIAKQFGVSRYAIEDIRSGKNWRHLSKGILPFPALPRGQEGATNPSAKLTWEQAEAIRARRTAGERCDDLAIEFGISRATAFKLVRGDTYRSISRRFA